MIAEAREALASAVGEEEKALVEGELEKPVVLEAETAAAESGLENLVVAEEEAWMDHLHGAKKMPSPNRYRPVTELGIKFPSPASNVYYKEDFKLFGPGRLFYRNAL